VKKRTEAGSPEVRCKPDSFLHTGRKELFPITTTIQNLIVDDEIRFLKALAKRLSIRNFEVVTATNGLEALEKARSYQLDLALVDLKMPGMSGEELLRKLKIEHPLMEVVILTGHGSEESKERCEADGSFSYLLLTGHGSLESAVELTKLGAFGYLPKPYELDKLLKVIADAYQERLKKKFAADQKTMDKIIELACTQSPMGYLNSVKDLDDENR
jgi:DNA-binding NtrC family response regulator